MRPATGGAGKPAPRTRSTLRQRFRGWRRARPFWGGLFALLGGVEIALIPLTAYRIILVSRSVTVAAVVGVVIALLALLAWATPTHTMLYGGLVVVLGVVSFVTSNVGGFLLGGLLSILGGALLFAWVPLPPPAAPVTAPLPAAPEVVSRADGGGDPGPS